MKPHTPKSPLAVISAIHFCAGVLFVLASFPVLLLLFRMFQSQFATAPYDYAMAEKARGIAEVIEFSTYVGTSVSLVVAGVFVKAVAHALEILWAIYTKQMEPK